MTQKTWNTVYADRKVGNLTLTIARAHDGWGWAVWDSKPKRAVVVHGGLIQRREVRETLLAERVAHGKERTEKAAKLYARRAAERILFRRAALAVKKEG